MARTLWGGVPVVKTALVFCILLAATTASAPACNCIAAPPSQQVLDAYLVMTILLSGLPFGLAGALFWIVRRTARSESPAADIGP